MTYRPHPGTWKSLQLSGPSSKALHKTMAPPSRILWSLELCILGFFFFPGLNSQSEAISHLKQVRGIYKYIDVKTQDYTKYEGKLFVTYFWPLHSDAWAWWVQG